MACSRCRRLCMLILILKMVLIVIGFTQQALFVINFIGLASNHYVFRLIRENPIIFPFELIAAYFDQLNLAIKQTIMVNVINAVQVVGIMTNSIVLLIGTIAINLILIAFEFAMNLDGEAQSKANLFLVCLELIVVALLTWLLLLLIVDKHQSQSTYHVYFTQTKLLRANIHCQSFTNLHHSFNDSTHS